MPALEATVIMAVITMVPANPATSAASALKSAMTFNPLSDRVELIEQDGNPDPFQDIPTGCLQLPPLASQMPVAGTT